MSLQVTLDKNDMVVGATRPPGQGRVWRFKRVRPFLPNQHSRKLTMEQEQEVCALYVDHPEKTTREIAELFGVKRESITYTVQGYGLPLRRPAPTRKPKEPTLGELVLRAAGHDDDPRPVWRVTVIRTVVEEIRADSLLDIAAHYDGTDANIVKVEKA